MTEMHYIFNSTIRIWTVFLVIKLMSIFSSPIENNCVVSSWPVLDQAEFWILFFLAVLYSPIDTKEPGSCVVWAKGTPYVLNHSVLAEKTVHDGIGSEDRSMHPEPSSQMSGDFFCCCKCWRAQQMCVVVKQKTNTRMAIFPNTWTSSLNSHIIF